MTAYYVVSEALANALKHAHASTVTVRAELVGDCLCLEIADDGVGGAEIGEGSGLLGLRDRVEAHDGSIRVSSEPGTGTSIYVEVPIARVAGDGPSEG